MIFRSKRTLDKMAKPSVSVVIPAYNEAATIGDLITDCRRFCDEIIVIDDGSIDNTAKIAKNKGATVIRHERNLGVTKAIQNGIHAANGDIIVTMDADGQHDPLDIPKLTSHLAEERADLTLGVRDDIPHRSEKIINQLTNLKVKCSDVGTGFRAINADLAKQLRLRGACLCGTFVLEADRKGARIMGVPIETKPRTYGERKAKTRHIRQFFHVLKDVIFG